MNHQAISPAAALAVALTAALAGCSAASQPDEDPAGTSSGALSATLGGHTYLSRPGGLAGGGGMSVPIDMSTVHKCASSAPRLVLAKDPVPAAFAVEHGGGQFLLAWIQETLGRPIVKYSLLSEDGEVTTPPAVLPVAAGQSPAADRPALATAFSSTHGGGQGAFALAWAAQESAGTVRVYMSRIDAQGIAEAPVQAAAAHMTCLDDLSLLMAWSAVESGRYTLALTAGSEGSACGPNGYLSVVTEEGAIAGAHAEPLFALTTRRPGTAQQAFAALGRHEGSVRLFALDSEAKHLASTPVMSVSNSGESHATRGSASAWAGENLLVATSRQPGIAVEKILSTGALVSTEQITDRQGMPYEVRFVSKEEGAARPTAAVLYGDPAAMYLVTRQENEDGATTQSETRISVGGAMGSGRVFWMPAVRKYRVVFGTRLGTTGQAYFADVACE